MSRATDAIERSVSHTEIVTIDYDDEAFAELEERSDDGARGDEVTEFWGRDEDGNEWRVHVRDAGDLDEPEHDE